MDNHNNGSKETCIPACNLQVGMLLVSPITGRQYTIRNLTRIGGVWIEIDSDAPVKHTRGINEKVKVVIDDHAS